MIRIDTIWLATGPMDIGYGTVTALASVIAVCKRLPNTPGATRPKVSSYVQLFFRHDYFIASLFASCAWADDKVPFFDNLSRELLAVIRLAVSVASADCKPPTFACLSSGLRLWSAMTACISACFSSIFCFSSRIIFKSF
ncbi:hypothetical protein D3C85_1272030 [compost metagenome]